MYHAEYILYSVNKYKFYCDEMYHKSGMIAWRRQAFIVYDVQDNCVVFKKTEHHFMMGAEQGYDFFRNIGPG